MRKKIQLNIPEPCHENWDKMLQAEKGKFCNACQKNVIDFTTMNDAQLAAFFKKPSNGSVCGRFMQDQLERDIEIPKKRIPWVKYFFQFALPAFLASSKAAAQGLVMLTGDTVIVADSKSDKIKKSVKETIKNIQGKVTDENGEGISYASVFIKGTTIGTATDTTGNFSLSYKGNDDSVELMSSCVGFKSTETMINLSEMQQAVCIFLKTMDTLGEVVIVSNIGEAKGRVVSGAMSIITTRTFFDVIRDTIFSSTKFIKLYPNPVRKNSFVTIDIKNADDGNYSLQLISLSGQVVLNKEAGINNSETVAKLNIPAIPSGTYILQIANKQSGKKYTEKIIVE